MIDSECSFTPNGNILSIHCHDMKAEIFALSEILKNRFKDRVKILRTYGSPFICSSQTSLYVVDTKDNKRYIRTYTIDKDTQATRGTKRFFYAGKGLIEEPLIGQLKQIMPAYSGIYALTEFRDTTNSYLSQNVYFVDENGESCHLQSYTCPQQAVCKIHALANDCKAIVHNDGTVTLANLFLQPFYTFAQRESLEGMRVLQSDLNPSQTKLALSFSDNGIVVYDLIDKTTKEVRGCRLSPCTAVRFYDDNHLATAHKNVKNNGISTAEVIISIWNIEGQPQRVAHSHQPEHKKCNTIAFSSDKKYILLGMGFFDVALQTMDSFKLKTLDPEKYIKILLYCNNYGIKKLFHSLKN